MSLTTNLINYWKFDESSGNASDLIGGVTLTNSNVTYVAGKINNGASFNGTSAQFSGTGGSSLSQPFSLQAWIKPIGGTYIMAFRNAGNNQNYDINLDVGSHVQVGTYNGSGGDSITSSTTVSASNWYHIVAVFNGASSALYVNNVAYTGTINALTCGTQWYFGANAGASWYSGLIDECAVWTRALTATEVSQLYNGGAGLAYPLVPATHPAYRTLLGVGI